MTEVSHQIKNIKIHPKDTFKLPYTITYEIHYAHNDSKVVDYFTNDILDYKSITVRVQNKKIIKCYGSDGSLFSKEITTYSKNGTPIWFEHDVHNADGTSLRDSFKLPKELF